MKSGLRLISLLLLAGCAHTKPNDFVQGRIRITPPIQKTLETRWVYRDGGTQVGHFTDAKGRTFTFCIDHRSGSATPGAIYLGSYPDERKSVRIVDEAEFKEKLAW